MTRLILCCWCFALASLFAAPADPPRIDSIQIDGDGLILSILAPPGARKITVESRDRVTGSVWTPRAIHRFAAQIAASTAVTLRISRAQMLEVLRVRSDYLDAPAQYFSGLTQFAESVTSIPPGGGFDDPGVGAPGDGTGTTTGTGPDAGPTAPGDDGPPPPVARAVAESDIWKIVGDTVYFFNQYRGLQFIDVSDPKSPALLGTFDLPAVGEQMYVLGSGHAALLARGGCDGPA
jgi:hypothetical protein